jgi:hypothetical protein
MNALSERHCDSRIDYTVLNVGTRQELEDQVLKVLKEIENIND